VMTRLVVPAIRDLEQRAPGVQVRVHEAGESVALSSLRGGDLDVVLVEDENLIDAPPVLTSAHLALDDPYRVAVPAAWPVPRSLDDLADRPWSAAHRGTSGPRSDRIRRSTGLGADGDSRLRGICCRPALVEAGLGVSIIRHWPYPSRSGPDCASSAFPNSAYDTSVR
jgi:DNA-binding transcriptional LysR family regulator